MHQLLYIIINKCEEINQVHQGTMQFWTEGTFHSGLQDASGYQWVKY